MSSRNITMTNATPPREKIAVPKPPSSQSFIRVLSG